MARRRKRTKSSAPDEAAEGGDPARSEPTAPPSSRDEGTGSADPAASGSLRAVENEPTDGAEAEGGPADGAEGDGSADPAGDGALETDGPEADAPADTPDDQPEIDSVSATVELPMSALPHGDGPIRASGSDGHNGRAPAVDDAATEDDAPAGSPAVESDGRRGEDDELAAALDGSGARHAVGAHSAAMVSSGAHPALSVGALRELTRLETALATTQEELLASQRQAAELRRELTEQSERVETVVAENEALEAQLAAAEYGRASLQARLVDEAADDGLQHSALRAYQQRVNELERDREALEQALAELREKLEASTPERDTASAGGSGADAEAQPSGEIDALRRRIAELEAGAEASHKSPERTRASLEEVERSLGQAIAERNRLTLALKRLERHFLLAHDQVGAWLEAAEMAISDRASLETDARSARTALRRARDYCESVDLALNVVATELASARSGFGSALDQLAETERRARLFQSRATQFGQAVGLARARIREMSSALIELSDELEGLGSTLDTEDEERREIGRVVGNAFEILQHHDEGLALLSERLQSQRNALTGLAGEIDAATEADELLQGEVARRDAVYREHVEAVRTIGSVLEDADVLIGRAQTGDELEADVDELTATPADWARPLTNESVSRPSEDVITSSQPAVRGGGAAPSKSDDETITSTQPSVPKFNRLAYTRLHDPELPAAARLEMLHEARPSIESARLSNSMEISAKAAFLVSSIDGTVTLGDLIDLSGLRHEEASQILIDLLLDGHIRIPELTRPPRP